MQKLNEILLSKSDNEFDKILKNMVCSWPNDTYTALQLFELLDTGTTYDLASQEILDFLQAMLLLKLNEENKTIESLIEEVNWWKASKE